MTRVGLICAKARPIRATAEGLQILKKVQKLILGYFLIRVTLQSWKKNNSYGSFPPHFILLKWVMSIALGLVKLTGAIQVSKTLYLVTIQSKWLLPLNLHKTLALLKLLNFLSCYWEKKKFFTFVLLLKHSAMLSLMSLLNDKDLIIDDLYIFIYKYANIHRMYCVWMY